MKITQLCLAAFAACLIFAGQAPADIVNIIQDVPTVDIIQQSSGVETPQGTASGQQAFAFRPAENPSNRARGQSFTFSDGSGSGSVYDISAITASLNTSADDAGFRPAGTLNFTVFEWDSNNPDVFTGFNAGTGGEFVTGHTEILSQSLAFPGGTGVLNNGDLLELAFNPGTLQLTDGISYGILYHYELNSFVDAAGNPLNEDVTISFDTRQDAGFAGALLSTGTAANFADTANGSSTSRDLNLFIAGTVAVPEPSSLAALGLGVLGFVTRRRRS